jgi:hypothetical protein
MLVIYGNENDTMLCYVFFFCRLWWNRKHHVLRMWWPRSCWTQVTFAFCFLIAFCCTLLLQRLQLGCHICCSYVALQCCIKVFVYRPFHFSMVLFLCNLPLIFWMVLIRIHFIGKLLIMFPLIGGGMAKAGVGFSLGQDFINIFLLVLCKTNS